MYHSYHLRVVSKSLGTGVWSEWAWFFGIMYELSCIAIYYSSQFWAFQSFGIAIMYYACVHDGVCMSELLCVIMGSALL